MKKIKFSSNLIFLCVIILLGNCTKLTYTCYSQINDLNFSFILKKNIFFKNQIVLDSNFVNNYIKVEKCEGIKLEQDDFQSRPKINDTFFSFSCIDDSSLFSVRIFNENEGTFSLSKFSSIDTVLCYSN